jgi:prepilin-type N-terminal cleavage/methylation domain-containing protein
MRSHLAAYGRGVTLVEVLVAIAIIGVLVGLLLVAVQRVREVAVRAQSQNNLRQIVLATHNFADAAEGRLPSIDGNPNSPNVGRSLFFALLPYIEQGSVYTSYSSDPSGNLPDRVKTYTSPADPTITAAAWGIASYASNAQVFHGSPALPRTFQDGTSTTIAFAEHYAVGCGGSTFLWSAYQPNDAPHRATFADGGPNVDRYANCGDDYPVTAGAPPTSTGAWPATFQVAPRLPAWTNCDPRLANTPHSGGMLTAFADGGVRIVTSGIAPTLYWGAVTPAGGEVLAEDW